MIIPSDWFRSSMRINYFRYAFNFFTSFGYFRTEREHYNAIRTVSQSLINNGIFVLDYLNVEKLSPPADGRHEDEIVNPLISA